MSIILHVSYWFFVSEMTYYVSSGTLNSTNSTQLVLVLQLFDLLGFDRFDLIENVLQNRQKIVRSAFGCDEASASSASAAGYNLLQHY